MIATSTLWLVVAGVGWAGGALVTLACCWMAARGDDETYADPDELGRERIGL